MTQPGSQRSAINKIYFEQTSFDYDDDAAAFNFQTPAFVAREVMTLLPATGLLHFYDVGIGTGLLYKAVTGHKPQDVAIDYAGCDIADNMLTRASFLLPPEKLHRLDIDHDSLPCADNVMDAVLSTSVFQYLENHRHALAEMARITKPGGYIAAAAVAQVKHATPLTALCYRIGQVFRHGPAYCETFVDPAELENICAGLGLTIIKNVMRFSHSHGQTHNYDAFLIAQKPL